MKSLVQNGWVFPLLLGLCSCAGKGPETPEPPRRPTPTPLPVLILDVGGNPITVEVARSPEARQKGLMHRDSMPENQGMLFVFEQPSYLSFWMKNTRIPLDIAFIRSDGTIAQISQMEPFDTGSTLSRYSTLYALEMNRDWFKNHGVKNGTKIDLSGLEALP